MTPEIMKNAQTDLTATINGRFSPSDWSEILATAERLWRNQVEASPTAGELMAWQEVVRDFHARKYWGFQPNYQAPKVRKPRNLGLQFIWIMFNAMVLTKVGILWFGQVYSRSDEPKDMLVFYGLIVFSLGNIAYFLWRNHAHPD